jgi:hypothetical protein
MNECPHEDPRGPRYCALCRLSEATRVTDNAIESVGRAANGEWIRVVERIIRDLAASGEPFTTDDVWDALREQSTTTREPRAMGAVMRRMVKSGFIEKAEGFRVSIRPKAHKNPKQLWRGK